MGEIVQWPAWRYGPNGQSRIFENEKDVPAGWADHPTRVKGGEKAPKAAPTPTPTPKAAEDVDADGWPWSADLHSATKTKTQAGLWRMKVGASRPGPKPGYPKPALDL